MGFQEALIAGIKDKIGSAVVEWTIAGREAAEAAKSLQDLIRDIRKNRERMVALYALIQKGHTAKDAQESASWVHQNL